MAELEPLDRLVRLAREEAPPPCEAAAETMARVRAAGKPWAASGFSGPRRAAAILAASAAAVALAVLLAGGTQRPATPATGPGGVAEGGLEEPAPVSTASTGIVVPTLDILGTIESEVNQLMGGAQPPHSAVIKT
jgi:hypothetical protein